MSKKILVIRLGSLGDIILTSATIINLKIAFPDSHITFLCKEEYGPVVEHIRGVDNIAAIPRKASALAYSRILINLDRGDFDIVLDLHGNIRSWLARKTITANEKAVYPKRRHGRLTAVKRKIIPKVWPHTIDLYNEGAAKVGAPAYCRRPVLDVAEEPLDDAVYRLLDQTGRFVVIAPGAAHPNKQWPPERFVETAVKLHQAEGVGIVWAVTGSQRDGATPEAGIKEGALVQLTDCPFSKLARVIATASLTIANDSGVAHASSAVGTPVVAVFGPTHPVLGFAPRGLSDQVIDVDEACRPCSLHGKKKCYRDQRYCFERIDAGRVFQAAREVLQRDWALSPAVFLDRDGTVIVDKHFLSDPEEVQFENGSVEAMGLLKTAGMKIVVISNQSGVARGLFEESSVEEVNGRLLEMTAARHVKIDGMYYCPHHPDGAIAAYAFPCRCRKPAAGMTEDAAYQLGLDLRKSFVVGDKIDDINLARVIGAMPLLVRTGYGSQQQDAIAGTGFYGSVTVVDNLLEAAKHIISIRSHG